MSAEPVFVAELPTRLLPAFAALASAYADAWKLDVVLSDVNGAVVAGTAAPDVDCTGSSGCGEARRRAIAESVRWGEPSVLLCPREHLLWAVPVMENLRVVGGVIASVSDTGVRRGAGVALSTADIRRAVADLLALAVDTNLTNPALLELRRAEARREAERAEAIHELKGQNLQTIRDLYLVEEPVLIAAIKRGDRGTAREILNRVLVGIYFLGRDRPLLLKSFLLELVVTMSRSAVEAGADPTDLLGANYSRFADLARIETEDALCAWLVSLLERIMDAIKTNQRYPVTVLLSAALTYLREHLHEDLSRDEVAKVACLSPSHFSRVVKENLGCSYTDLLARMRVERARELLVRTEKSLVQICLDCGFSDQSYFTKVFQKHTGRTPGEYRREHRGVL